MSTKRRSCLVKEKSDEAEDVTNEKIENIIHFGKIKKPITVFVTRAEKLPRKVGKRIQKLNPIELENAELCPVPILDSKILKLKEPIHKRILKLGGGSPGENEAVVWIAKGKIFYLLEHDKVIKARLKFQREFTF